MDVFIRLDDLLNTTEGMEVIRNNTKNDDGTDTVNGVEWFNFNGIQATNLYISGNSMISFGTNSSSNRLSVCNRDGACYFLYRQEGVLLTTKFLKIRWEGFTYYSSQDSQYSLIWELFLFEGGGLYLNIVSVPSNQSYLGTSNLTCGSNIYSFLVTASIPVEYSFIPNAEGGFSKLDGRYPIETKYFSNGYVEIQCLLIQSISSALRSVIEWECYEPEGTSINVYAKIDNGSYVKCENAEKIPCIVDGQNYSNSVLYIKVELSTDDITVSPAVYKILLQLLNYGDDNILVLEMGTGTTTNIQNSIGEVNVSYAGGSLIGEGGMVPNFSKSFLPKNLIYKGHQHDVEHINVSATAGIIPVRIYYKATQHLENIGIDMSAKMLLIHVDDL